VVFQDEASASDLCSNPPHESASAVRYRLAPPKKFETSGKSPADIQHRKNKARAGKLVAGFMNRTAVRISQRLSSGRASRERDISRRQRKNNTL
jgi:hypothetical protein